jgi:hypothetical protein
MTRRQRTKLVETRAELILADEGSAGEFVRHFEAEMMRGRMWRRLVRLGRLFAWRSGRTAQARSSHWVPADPWAWGADDLLGE